MSTSLDFSTLAAAINEQPSAAEQTFTITETVPTPDYTILENKEEQNAERSQYLAAQTNADFDGAELETVIAQVTLIEPFGYPSVYNQKALGEATYGQTLDLNKVMPDQPRLGWLANPKNWSVLSTSAAPDEAVTEPGASDWFGSCLAAVGGFFVTNPTDVEVWPDEIIVPTPFGDAIARRAMLLWSKDGTINTSQYVFVKITKSINRNADAVHEYMLKHLARMVNGSTTITHQALSDFHLVSMLREGLFDPDIRWYANLPSFFVQIFMSNPSNQHRADASYNSSSWHNKVRYNRSVANDAVTHYRLVLGGELTEDDYVDDSELIARAMMLQVRQRISSCSEVREARMKARHTK